LGDDLDEHAADSDGPRVLPRARGGVRRSNRERDGADENPDHADSGGQQDRREQRGSERGRAARPQHVTGQQDSDERQRDGHQALHRAGEGGERPVGRLRRGGYRHCGRQA
jgi:hypothetical protein